MTAVLEGNLDYVLFVYGLGFVLLAITLLGLRTTSHFADRVEDGWRRLPRCSVSTRGRTCWRCTGTPGRGPPTSRARSCSTVAYWCPLRVRATCWSALGGRRVGRWVVRAAPRGGRSGGVRRSARPACDGRPGPRSPGWSVGRRRIRALRPFRRQAWTRPARWRPSAMALFVVASASDPRRTSHRPPPSTRKPSSAPAGFPVQLLAHGVAVPFLVGLWPYYRAMLQRRASRYRDRASTGAERDAWSPRSL